MIKVMVDVDGVVANFHGHLVSVYNDKHDSNMSVNDIRMWDLPADMRALFKDNFDFFMNIKPLTDGIDGVLELSRTKGIQVLLCSVTGGSFDVARAKYLWCAEHLPGIPLALTALDKSAYRCDVIIDDATHHLTNSKAKLKICVSWPWNYGYLADLRIHPFSEWHIIDVIKMWFEGED